MIHLLAQDMIEPPSATATAGELWQWIVYALLVVAMYQEVRRVRMSKLHHDERERVRTEESEKRATQYSEFKDYLIKAAANQEKLIGLLGSIKEKL